MGWNSRGGLNRGWHRPRDPWETKRVDTDSLICPPREKFLGRWADHLSTAPSLDPHEGAFIANWSDPRPPRWLARGSCSNQSSWGEHKYSTPGLSTHVFVLRPRSVCDRLPHALGHKKSLRGREAAKGPHPPGYRIGLATLSLLRHHRETGAAGNRLTPRTSIGTILWKCLPSLGVDAHACPSTILAASTTGTPSRAITGLARLKRALEQPQVGTVTLLFRSLFPRPCRGAVGSSDGGNSRLGMNNRCGQSRKLRDDRGVVAALTDILRNKEFASKRARETKRGHQAQPGRSLELFQRLRGKKKPRRSPGRPHLLICRDPRRSKMASSQYVSTVNSPSPWGVFMYSAMSGVPCQSGYGNSPGFPTEASLTWTLLFSFFFSIFAGDCVRGKRLFAGESEGKAGRKHPTRGARREGAGRGARLYFLGGRWSIHTHHKRKRRRMWRVGGW